MFAPPRRAILFLAIALALLGSGCGSGGSDASTPAVADSPAGAKIEADAQDERRLALEVQDYFVRNCALPGAIRKVPDKYRDSPLFAMFKRHLKGDEAMCGQIASIGVEGTRVTVTSDISEAARRGAGESFCLLMQGSDVADFTPGHELRDIDGETIKVCPARSD